MINDNEWIVVGLITSAHGIKGKIKIKSLSDFEEDFETRSKMVTKEKEHPKLFELTAGFKQPGKDFYIVSFKGINNRSEAEKLKNQKLW